MRILFSIATATLLLGVASANATPVTVGQDELVETEGAVRLRTIISLPDVIDDTGFIGTSDGGVGETESSLNGLVGDGPGGTTGSGENATYSAYAKLVGADSLPQLGVGVDASSGPGTNFEAYAVAHALQSYTYTGTESMEFVLRFNLDGLIGGDYLDYLTASILIGNENYDPDDPFGELGPATVIDNAELFNSGDNTENNVLVNLTDFVTFVMDPGDTVWLEVTMTAIGQDDIFEGGVSVIDAMHTLSGSFTSGDTSLLLAGLQAPVTAAPEPGTFGLFGFGLAGLMAARRRRKASAEAA